MPTLDSSYVYPGVVASVLGVVVALGLFVPFVAVAYRSRGQLGLGGMIWSFALLVYALALVAYVLLPLPEVTPGFCSTYAPSPQTDVLQAARDVRAGGVSTARELLDNAAFRQVALNVWFFVPLGVFVRVLARRGVVLATLGGFCVSAFLELTQYTGVWSVYPCAYRLFDVDDLVANTAGAVIGSVLSAVFVRRHVERRDPRAPREVTAGRRLTGIACDLVVVFVVGTALVVAYRFGTTYVLRWDQARVDAHPTFEALLQWAVPALLQLVVVLGSGETVGEQAVRLAARPTGALPVPLTRVLRWTFGIGGLCLLQLLDAGWTTPVSVVVLVLSLLAVATTRGHRGLASVLSGADVVDERERPGATEYHQPVRTG